MNACSPPLEIACEKCCLVNQINGLVSPSSVVLLYIPQSLSNGTFLLFILSFIATVVNEFGLMEYDQEV